MLHVTDRQATGDLIRAQLELFDQSARAAGLSDDERRAALGVAEAEWAGWRECLTRGATPPTAPPDLLCRIGRATFFLIVQVERMEMAA